MLNVQFSLSISLSRRLAAPKHSDGGSEDGSVAKAEVLQHRTKLEVLRWLAAWRSFTLACRVAQLYADLPRGAALRGHNSRTFTLSKTGLKCKRGCDG
jgi:hypothetical protein